MSDRYRAVIFDFFGTLTGPIQRGPRHALVAERLGCTTADLTRVLNRSYHARIRGDHGCPITSLGSLAGELGLTPDRDQLTAAVHARIEAIRADIRLRREAVPTLRALRAMGIRIGLITDCSFELPVILPTLGLNRLLDAAVYSVRVRLAKPDPRLYDIARRRLRVRPAECLYVGDGGGRELTGAVRAGMTAVRLAAPDLAGHLTFNAEPDWPGPAIDALPDILGFLPVPGWAGGPPYWADGRQLIASAVGPGHLT